MKRVCILGATGSIGQSSLQVIENNLDKYIVHSVTGNKNVEKMMQIILHFKPKMVSMANEQAQKILKHLVSSLPFKVQVIDDINELVQDDEIDIYICAIVGSNGLKSTIEAIKSGKTIALANKESLVMTGKIFFELAKKYNCQVLPVDSEHSAIFQCLPENCQNTIGFCDLRANGVKKIILTGSGGACRDIELERLNSIKKEDALNHPIWSMGSKITIDSATMMNKGLEFIEAYYLFNSSIEDIEVIIHPQSIIHSMVSYIDGAVLAQMGLPDMKTPIARALAYPNRVNSTIEPIDFCTLDKLEFKAPDPKRYPCLFLAKQAIAYGQGATTAINAANEVAVEAFLEDRIKFTNIYDICAKSMDKALNLKANSLEEILEVDSITRQYAQELVQGAI